VSQYPLGYSKANLLEQAFERKDAALIITAVPREGPPFAAKIIRNLDNLDFPFPFQIDANDLIFPYTESAWRRSPLSKQSVSLTAILDPDGILATSEYSHFGFATSSVDTPPQSEKTGELVVETGKVPAARNFASRGTTWMGKGEMPSLLPRREAKISVSLKADGSSYSPSELDLLGRIDSFLEKK